ncbi:MAG: polyprenyl diphosphate synthase [Sphaerochaetaceae bacterium]|jgi:undecaprenyl diphosphate synthase|nr:polyprenyl diphosphate synthase [Sphaerochaetaceae bacterium]
MHIGLILDGNGRWAARHGLPRVAGHIEGLKTAKKIVAEAARRPDIDFVTLYVFSTENFRRPKTEVDYLTNLIATALPSAMKFYREHGVRVIVRGRRDDLTDRMRRKIEQTEQMTSSFDKVTCILALNYGGQDEIERAVNAFIKSSPGSMITASDIRACMEHPEIPPVDIIARSAGEKRLSNFLLWDSAYAELYFDDKLWPDWDEEDLDRIIEAYKTRNRKYGGL